MFSVLPKGGAFALGSGDYDPSQLISISERLNYPLIVVTFNYRSDDNQMLMFQPRIIRIHDLV